MVRGNGSARAGTSVKAIARPNTIRISMRPRPPHGTLDDDLSTITSSPFVTSLALALQRSSRLARNAQRNGPFWPRLHCTRGQQMSDFDPAAGISLSPRGVIQTGMRILHQCRAKKKRLAAGGNPQLVDFRGFG